MNDLLPRVPIVPAEAHEATLRLHAERPVVEARQVEGDIVRVAAVTHVREQAVEVPLTREIIDIERIAIGKVVEIAPPIRYEDDVTILPVLEEVEVVIIERRLVLKEEIHVRRRRITEMYSETVSLREQSAVVTRLVAGQAYPDRAADTMPTDTEIPTEES
jgi:stress response protein YsnF